MAVDVNIPSVIPRLTTSQRINSKPQSNGFLVYQTDNQKGLYYWQDGAWYFINAAIALAGSIRPTNPLIGQSFFDTTLGFRIDWNGTNWVNSTGAIV